MPEEKDILKKLESLKRNSPLDVPEGYFENLSEGIMAKINQEPETISLDNEKDSARPLWRLVKNQMAIAASFVALFLLAYTAIQIINPDKPAPELTTAEIFASIEADLYYIEEATLIEATSVSNGHDQNSPDNLSSEDIIDYLTAEGVDFDLLNDF